MTNETPSCGFGVPRLRRLAHKGEALKSRLKTGLSIFDAPKLVGDLKHNVEIARGGGGNVGMGEIQSYLGLLYRQKSFALFAEPAKWQAAVDEANRWQQKALEARGGKS